MGSIARAFAETNNTTNRRGIMRSINFITELATGIAVMFLLAAALINN
jgi:hypothetical protein